MTSNTPPPDPLYNKIASTTQQLFQVRPYKWQIQIIQDIVLSHQSNNKQDMLVVRPKVSTIPHLPGQTIPSPFREF